MKKEIIIWQLIILFLGILLILILSSYFREKNEIEGSIGRANCIIEMYKLEYDSVSVNYDICNDIGSFRKIFNRL